jgi:inhibitor of cysteine peptidase
MRIVKIILAACWFFSVVAYADIATVNTYTEDKSAIIATAKKPEFIIKLNSNPTTGYGWFLRSYDSNLVMPVKHVYVAPDKKLVGAPGYELWTFRIKPAALVVPQQTMITLVYARPWETESQEGAMQKVFTVTAVNK